MHFARVLLLPVLLIASLVDVASAQQSTWHVFPQFAFGGGWESTLMVQAGRHTHKLRIWCAGLSSDAGFFRQRFLENQ